MTHSPVLLKEMLHYLAPKANEVFVDATFGAGGYTEEILRIDGTKVIAIDQDPSTVKYVNSLKEIYPERIEYICDNFSNISNILSGNKVDGIVLDLGVSSMQLDQAERGFSFMRDGPLDMRMSSSGTSAADFVNSAEEQELARVIFEYGDERASRRIAKSIVLEREISPIDTTLRLASIVRKAIGFKAGKIDPATKTFQAIRIWVNQEMEVLCRFLEQVEKLLKDGGRLVVITFHYTEDRIVKQYLQSKVEKIEARSKYAPVQHYNGIYKLLSKKSVPPSREEIKRNPRSRSAKLRAAIRTYNNQLVVA